VTAWMLFLALLMAFAGNQTHDFVFTKPNTLTSSSRLFSHMSANMTCFNQQLCKAKILAIIVLATSPSSVC